MTDKTEAQPEALRLAEALLEQAEHHRDLAHCCDCRPEDTVNWDHFLQCGNAATELRRQHAEIQQLKAQLSARQAAPDGQVDAARRRLAEAFPQAADCFHHLYIEGFKSGHAKGRVRGERATLREVGAFAEAILAAPPPPEREPLLPDFPVAKLHSPTCWCETCDTTANSGLRSRMSLCPDCGNKRCPKANHHNNACTNSNAPGQPGSSWEHVKPHGATNDNP